VLSICKALGCIPSTHTHTSDHQSCVGRPKAALPQISSKSPVDPPPSVPLTRAFMLSPALSSQETAVPRTWDGKGCELGTCQDPETQSQEGIRQSESQDVGRNEAGDDTGQGQDKWRLGIKHLSLHTSDMQRSCDQRLSGALPPNQAPSCRWAGEAERRHCRFKVTLRL
jgi:hypothetical protein